VIKIQNRDFINKLYRNENKRIDLPEEVVKLLQDEGLPYLEALEKSDHLVRRFKVVIDKKIRDCRNQGITPRYLFDDSNDDILIRTDLVVDIQEEKDIRRIIERKEQVSELLKSISWQEFEKLCGLIFQINDILDCNVTRGSKDGGIDVYGWLRYPSSRRIFHEINMRVIGQGKHRSKGGEVSNAEVSKFVTDVDKLRKKQGFSLFVLPLEFIDSPHPLVPIFITNGYYRRDALKTAENYGVIIWNGEQISEDLAKYFNLTYFVSNGRIDKEKFRNYLNQ